jgi:hypothetical protein
MGLKLKSDTYRDGSLIPFSMFVLPSAVLVINRRTCQAFLKFREIKKSQEIFFKVTHPSVFLHDWLISKNKNH